MAGIPKMATASERREHYRDNMLVGFNALADLYYEYWGEYFHLALFDPGDDPEDVASAYERTHRRYLDELGGGSAGRILDVACGGGAFSAWLADHAAGEVVGVDQSDSQLAHARRWVAGGARSNLSFVRHDAMALATLGGPAFDAAVCLDAACYLPDRVGALRGIASRLRPGGRLLLVDWCRSEHPLRLQQELLIEPLCRYWAIADMETSAGYRRGFEAAGFRVERIEDLSDRVVPNWERGYRAALGALAEPVRLGRILRLAAASVQHGSLAVQAAKDQFQVALLSKAAAESGVLRYVSVLAERT